MADSTLNRFLASGTAAERAAFTPSPPTPASGPSQTYIWTEEDTNKVYAWDQAAAAWFEVGAGSVPDPIVPADGTQNITGALVVSGAVSGSNLSGTNTGDQTSIVGITGTKAQFDTAVTDGNFLYVGDVTQYTDEMAQDAIGAMVDASLTYVDATPLLQRSALTGDVTASAGSNATTIANDAVTNAKLANVATATIKGRITAATGDPEDLTGTQATTLLDTFTTALKGLAPASGGGTTNFLRADGTWAAPPSGGAPAYTDITSVPTDRLLGRDTAATGNAEAITVGGGIEFTGSGGIQTSAFTGDVTKAAGGTATTIPNDTVTFAKMQNSSAASKLLGRGSAAGAGDFEEITLGTNLSMSGTTLNATGGGSVAWGAITGTLSSQTDLQTALDGKVSDTGDTMTGQLLINASGTVTPLILQAGAGNINFYKDSTPTIAWHIGLSTSPGNAAGNNLNFAPYSSGGGWATAVLVMSTTSLAASVDVTVPDEAFGSGWNASVEVPTKNAVYDKITTGLTATELAANSGGGTTNFLRADGSWAAAGGGSTPTGTGFRHITAGVEDAAAKLVDTADVNDAQITYAKIQNVGSLSVFGRSANSAGVGADIAAGSDFNVLRRSGTSIGFGTIDLSSNNCVGTSQLPLGNIADISAASVLGRVSTTGAPTAIASATNGHVLRRSSGSVGWGTLEITSFADGIITGAKLTTTQQMRSITFIIDGGGSAITTGIKGDLEIPFACTITGWTMLADQSGSIVVDIWKDTYANYPPTVADTITASDKPTISAATKGQDLAPTGWTTAVAAGDTLRFNVDSVSTVTRVTLSIRVLVTG